MKLNYLTAAIALSMCLSACNQYQVNLNGHTLYQPLPLFSDFVIGDPGLSRCVKQAIKTKKITLVEELTELGCRHEGIKSTEGIEIFKNLATLDLAYNQLEDFESLGLLTKLKTLNLDGNKALACNTVNAIAANGVKVTGSDCLH